MIIINNNCICLPRWQIYCKRTLIIDQMLMNYFMRESQRYWYTCACYTFVTAKIMNNIKLIMSLPFQLLGLFQLMKRFEDTSEDELGSSIEQNRKTKRR